MDLPPGWSYPLPETMLKTSQTSNPVIANVSSFFRRPSKIVKQNSRNTSPKHLGRRRTTTNVPVTRTRSVLDKQRSSVPQQSVAQRQPRPLSWHPNTFVDFSVPTQDFTSFDPMSTLNQYQFYNPYYTTAVNGLVTPMAYPAIDEPQIQELITPLEELSAQEADSNYNAGFEGTQYWWGQGMPKQQQQYTMDSMFQPQSQSQNWQWNSQHVPDIQTAPSSPDFLPIQGGIEVSPLILNMQRPVPAVEGEELVGMGLYDSPAEVQSSSLLFSTSLPAVAGRKTLKLEDSFEPASESGDAERDLDDENEYDDDDAPSEPADNSPALFPTYTEPYTQPIPNLAGHSFFFEQDSNATFTPYTGDTTFMNLGVYGTGYSGYSWA